MPKARLLLASPEKSGLGLGEVRRSMFHDNLKNWKGHKLRTKVGKSTFSCSSGSGTCLTPHLSLFEEPPDRKPMQQQPFGNYSSILYTHILSSRKRTSEISISPTKLSTNISENRPLSFGEEGQPILEKRTNSILKSSWTSLSESEKMYENPCSYKTRSLGSYRPIVLSIIDQ